MKKDEKIYAVEDLTARLKEAKSVVIADYRGLTVGQISDLRLKVKKSGGELIVVKNTLLERALTNVGATKDDFVIEGPTAVVIAHDDEMAPLKQVAEFARKTGLPSLKSGVWEGKILSADEITRLSLIPGKNELDARLVSLLYSPLGRLAYLLTANQRKLLFILKTRSEVN